MASQSVCGSFSLCYPKIKSYNRSFFLERICSASGVISGRNQKFRSISAKKFHTAFATGLKRIKNDFPLFRLNQAGKMSASNSDLGKFAEGSDSENVTGRGKDEFEPFLVLEEGKLESSHKKPETGSFPWTTALLALMMSSIMPPYPIIYLGYLDRLSLDPAFYAVLATVLIITDRVQRPYLQFKLSAKICNAITEMGGYKPSFLTAGLKVIVPLIAAYITWPCLGTKGLEVITPVLVGCFAQFIFEISPKIRASSYWPLVPIILEIYRVYQLTRAALSVEALIKLDDFRGVCCWVGIVAMCQALATLCLWCLITFLFKVFPSKPVAEKQ